MSVSVEVPFLGDSVTEAIIGEWLKSPGDFVAQDEELVVLETDKIATSVPSPVAGTVKELKGEIDGTVAVGDVIAIIEPGDAPSAGDAAASNKGDKATGGEGKSDQSGGAGASTVAPPTETSAGKPGQTSGAAPSTEKIDIARDQAIQSAHDLSPAVARLVEEHGLDASQIKATGPGGRLLKGDVLDHIANPPAAKSSQSSQAKPAAPARDTGADEGDEPVERVKMSKLRQTVARRLVEAQQTAAMLTTFNEVDMTAIMELRSSYKDAFARKYGIKLGFMSFFVKAAIEALKEYPAVNAEIDGDHIVYKNFYHIGVAVGGPRGLVVPVIRHADKKSFAGVELEIGELANKVKDNKLALDDMRGGTFTISNGGIYGSMLSTPILNPPQVGILGMHNIVERPVAIDGQVVIRPMMNLALSYDHRIIDGKEAVSFLVRLKECIETPERILLEI